MKILIVEDDREVAHALRLGLEYDYVVDLAFNGQEGLFKALTNEYDFVILDLNLPDTHGFDVCKELRAEGLTQPILVLTGQELKESEILLLDAGADDYLIKPFHLKQIKARLRALLRRTEWWSESQNLNVGPFKLNLKTQLAYYQHQPFKLSKKEFLLLHLLLRHVNVPLSRLKLLEHVWSGQLSANSNTLDVHICNLRRKIGAQGHNLIQTVHGSGYMLVTEET